MILAATTGETIGAWVLIVVLLGPLIALQWLRRFPGALTRLDSWAFAHPWAWAAIGAAVSFVPICLVMALINAPLLLAVLVAAVWFAVIGWSMTRGPGRRWHDQRSTDPFQPR